MRMVRAKKLYIRGNHDRVASGIDDGSGFNGPAREAAVWTRDHLSTPNRKFLEALPQGPRPYKDIVLCHGSPFDEDEYVFSEHHAALVLAEYDAPIVFFGHTHLPAIFSLSPEGHLGGTFVKEESTFKLDPRNRYLINPGSVGQPRDRNPESSFAMYDSKKRTVKFFRVAYDIPATQQAILRAGLPKVLAARLSYGT
jgi:diadenosine tetraphosphatase ApaH/serine/threonine PP2A family protein phosphatase